MRAFLLSMACMAATTTISFAQDEAREHVPIAHYRETTGSEVIVGHGFAPSEQLFSNSNMHGLSYNTDQYTGAISVTYRYHISHVVSLGVAFAFENEQGTYNQNYNSIYYYNNYTNGYYQPYYYNNYGRFRRSSYTIAPEITFNYGDFAGGRLRLYSVVGMGYTVRDEVITDAATNTEYTSPYANRVHFNAYGSPIGVRIGGRLSGYFEIGMGYKGVLSYGATYRF